MILELDKASTLKTNSNKKLLCLCDDCGDQFTRQFQLLNRADKHRCRPCALKQKYATMNRDNIRTSNMKRVGTNHPRWNPNKSNFTTYSNQVRWLSEKNYRDNMKVLNPENHTRTLCGIDGGYQLDHKVSIKKGFRNGISVENISAVSNLQMLPWQINRTKAA